MAIVLANLNPSIYCLVTGQHELKHTQGAAKVRVLHPHTAITLEEQQHVHGVVEV